jgi:hypothetical protein
MSSDLSGEITAIATAVLAAFAIITAVFAFLAYRKQSQEVKVLQQQLKDQLEATARQAAASELQAKQQHMAQASKVFVVHLPMAGKDDNLRIVNTSEQPVYDVKVFLGDSSEKRAAQDLGTILPGAAVDTELPDHTHAILRFRDAAKSRWLRMEGGDLIEELDATPPGKGKTYRFTDPP